MTESNVQPFEFRGNPVATVTTENGTVLFCAKHVATALGYSNTNDAIRKHCRHIDGVANRYPITDSLGRTQQAVFLTEGDVYRLIASSKLPSAVEFEHWLFDEVVPQIRRTGGYIPQAETRRPQARLESTGGHRLPGPAVRDKPQGAGPWRIRVSRIRNREKRKRCRRRTVQGSRRHQHHQSH